jgi:molybdopterin converting factor subunit 1
LELKVIKVKVLFFASLRDFTGQKAVSMSISPGATISELIDRLIESFPKLNSVRETMVPAINRSYVDDDQPIPDGAEIALFPPVSGG